MNRLLPGTHVGAAGPGGTGWGPSQHATGWALKGLEGQAAPGCGGEHSRAQPKHEGPEDCSTHPGHPRQASAHPATPP